MEFTQTELLITVISRLLNGCRHVAVGASSPIAASAALLTRELTGGELRVTILGSRTNCFFTSGGVELFDLAGQGRVDAFFLGGGQIDGQANINLVGTGEYPATPVRWPGSFGSAYLYYLVPKVILFREEHSLRVLVPKVDFVSAPGITSANVYRPGGPQALLTSLGLFSFNADRQRFKLESIHPRHSLQEIIDNTGFEFDQAPTLITTPGPDAAVLELIRGKIRAEIAECYPRFAQQQETAAR